MSFDIVRSIHDYLYVWYFATFVVIVGGWYLFRWKRRKVDIEPVTTLSEFNKAGYCRPYQINPEQEGASFLEFERSNGDIEKKRIGQPFTFNLDNATIERHHFNPRGSFECLEPAKLFQGYVPEKKEKN